MSMSELLCYGGLACVGATVIASVVAVVYFRGAKQRLLAQLELEYGKRQQ